MLKERQNELAQSGKEEWKEGGREGEEASGGHRGRMKGRTRLGRKEGIVTIINMQQSIKEGAHSAHQGATITRTLLGPGGEYAGGQRVLLIVLQCVG